jgi:hypothetical protein
MDALNTPILFIVFNKADTTKKVFDAIRTVKPKKLFIAADGPRPNRKDDEENCKQVKAIFSNIDWDCEVKTLFRDKNLGCKVAVSSAIDWFFQNVEEGIILEDDTLPDPSFFKYCEELLSYYKNDERIMLISGDNFQFGKHTTKHSYYFSMFNHIWGWASWRRAWKKFDVKMKRWPELKKSRWLNGMLVDKKAIRMWESAFDKVYEGKIDTWDYQWTFACWANNGLTVLPNVNLVSNIGFGALATHTKLENKMANLKASSINFPLSHPPLVARNSEADKRTLKYSVSEASILKRIIRKIRTAVSQS